MKRRDLLAVAASAVAAPWVHAQSVSVANQRAYSTHLSVSTRRLGRHSGAVVGTSFVASFVANCCG
jgi:hypothetical protein